ncbi:MAG: N-acetylmuramoyl-L-alanine amidase [Polyangiaceae bacterium]
MALALRVLVLEALLACASCAQPAGRLVDAGDADEGTIARARELAGETATLPPRAETLALAQSVEARAVREGGGARATELHSLAARILERVWRVEGRDQDATEAIELYRSAARDMGTAGACEPALRGARLAGDEARDAAIAYSELYRAERRLGAAQARAGRVAKPGVVGGTGADPACAVSIASALAALDAFRPPARVLEAIDQGLAGEGALPPPPDAGALVAVAPSIVGIEAWPGDESSRVVISLDRPAHFRAGDEAIAGGRGARTFVDLDGVDVGTVARDLPMAGIVTRVHSEATTTGARVVLDLDGRAYRRVFYLPEPYRVIIDIARHPPGATARGQRVVARVALDPGHGGSDPGAIGPSGVKEKDITLAIAEKVAPVLARDGVQVLLTRDDDRFVSLEERTARANAFGADLFVSIHCNAAENHAKRGVETYMLDTARDEMAGRIAARENATSAAAGAEIGSILASMRLADQSARSGRLADLLQRAALASLKGAYADAVDGGVHTAGFYVLVGARMPGVLFETSYISNPNEETRLASDDYEQRLADGIVNAVKAYREGR